jgi:hypothetical protein
MVDGVGWVDGTGIFGWVSEEREVSGRVSFGRVAHSERWLIDPRGVYQETFSLVFLQVVKDTPGDRFQR